MTELDIAAKKCHRLRLFFGPQEEGGLVVCAACRGPVEAHHDGVCNQTRADLSHSAYCVVCGQSRDAHPPESRKKNQMSRMTDEQIDCCRRIGRNEEERVTSIGLAEIDALCAEATLRGKERDTAWEDAAKLLTEVAATIERIAKSTDDASLLMLAKIRADTYRDAARLLQEVLHKKVARR